MIHILIISIWLIGSIPTYFVNKFFMIKFKKTLRYTQYYTNSDMMFNIFLSVLGSWFTMIMVTLMNINLINENYNEWLEKKSKY